MTKVKITKVKTALRHKKKGRPRKWQKNKPGEMNRKAGIQESEKKQTVNIEADKRDLVSV